MKKVLSFFSGAMGLDLGLEMAGLEIISCCEVDKCAQKTISLNRPKVHLFKDIVGLTSESILQDLGVQADDIFLIAGGPPCQSFSTAGKRQSFNDRRGNVFLQYIQISLDIRPPYILVENVRGLLSAALSPPISGSKVRSTKKSQKDQLCIMLLNCLSQQDYTVNFQLYNTANYGVPQSRERIILPV